MVEIPDKEYQQLQSSLKELTAQAALRQREADDASRMLTLVRDSNDAIIIQDCEGKILAWNRGAEVMFGYSEQEAVQMSIWRLIPPERAAEKTDFTRRLLAGDKIASFKTRRVTKDGRLLDVWLTVTRLLDEAGAVSGIASTERDITEQKRAEEALKASVERFKTIFNEAPLGIALINSLTGQVYEVNRMFAKIAGRTLEQMTHIDWMTITHPDDVQKDLDHMALLNAGKIPGFQMEKRYLHPDGTVVWINMTIAPLKTEDNAQPRHLCMIEDITERRRVEETKRAGEIAQAANRAKSEFLTNMSHELRTPLNSINGFSEVLCDETFGPLNEKQKKYANNILTSGQHLLLLINQILDLAKVEAGKLKLALSSLPIKSLLRQIFLLTEDVASKKKLHVLLEIAEDLPNIVADELKVKEIIYNLLSNAVKYTPEGGEIGMRAKSAGSEIEIVVWDTGAGIAPENMEKIFEGFFRVATPHARVTEGTGLGLPLSRRLVELHGGKLAVESEGLDKGTLVRVTLPVISKGET